MISTLSLSLVLGMTSQDPNMDFFTPPKELDQIKWMMGKWKGTGMGLNPGGEGEMKIAGSANCAMELGRWVAWTGDYSMGPMGTMNGRMMLTYNPISKKFEGTWFDNMASYAMPCTGYIEGKYLVLWSEEMDDPMIPGQKTKFKITYSNEGKNKIGLAVKFRMDGQYLNAVTMTYTK